MNSITTKTATSSLDSINPAKMKKIIGLLRKVINTRSKNPILRTIHVYADKDEGTTFTATDLDRHLEIHLPGVVVNLKSGCYDTKTLEYHFAGGIDVDRLAIDSEEFPPTPNVVSDGIMINNKVGYDFVESFTSVAPFASKDENRYVLNGVFFDGEKSQVVATDGKTLGAVKVDWAGDQKIPSFILPSKAVALLSPKGTSVGMVKLAPDGRMMSIYGQYLVGSGKATTPALFTLTSKLIDGKYPDYEQVIPRDNPRRHDMVWDNWFRLPDPSATGIKLNEKSQQLFILGDGEMRLSDEKASPKIEKLPIGKTEVKVSRRKNEGDPFPRCGFNPFFLERARRFGFTWVSVTDEAEASGCVMNPLYAQSGNRTVVIMPMRIV